MKEVAEILGRLIAVLVIKGILTDTEKAFVLGNITEAEWIEKEEITDRPGCWIHKGDGDICSACLEMVEGFPTRYCPNCGAKMKEETT